MARKLKPKFDKQIIIEAFAEMAREKGMDREALQEILKETLSMLVRKKYGNEANFDIVVNMDKGDLEIYMIRTVVAAVEDPVLQISVEEANQGVESYEEGDEFLEEITLENIAESFGRRLINMAGQTLNQRIRDVEKENVLNEYEQKIGEIIVGEVYQVRRSDVFIMHNGNELRIPREEQIPRERYRKNEPIRAIVKEVRRQQPGVTSGTGPDIILSRSDNMFLARLFEIEIPEIYDGVIEIKGIAREPGERAKVSVQSYDDRIDPVGACVGMKGIRIHSIVRELDNENIDVINYSDDPVVYIMRALAPARVKEIKLVPETRSATVIVSDEQVSLAIGKNGQNVRLASRLTGFSITLVKEGGEDIELIEFRDELGEELYMHIIHAEIDTAREFLEADLERLLAIPTMTKELLLELRGIMLEEFNEREKDDVRQAILAMPDAQPSSVSIPTNGATEQAVETQPEGSSEQA
jgi:N utilization substance protein A